MASTRFGDNGLAIGCAYYGWVSVLGGERHVHDGSSNFGRVYPDNEIAAAFACREAQVDYAKVPDVVEQTAALLAEGRIVGWFQGGSEFGPRALGNRSILADPRREGVKDFINARIKRREDFRPFAPAILERCVVEYFDWDVPSPYMVLVAPAKPNRRDELSSVIHRDGSGRLQTVTPASNARFHALLESFARRTGLPVLLNTSFNRRGMPIVESPAQAIAFFLESELDVLVIGDFVGYRRPLSSELAPDLEERMHRLEQVLRRHPVEAGVVGGLCELVIRGTRAWTMNLSPDSLAVSAGKSGRPDVSLELSEADFWRLADDPFEIAAQLVAEDRLIITGSKSHAAVLMWMLQRALHAGQ